MSPAAKVPPAPKRRSRLAPFGDTASGALWYLMLVVVLPTLSLVIAGLVFLWRDGWFLEVLIGWLAVTLVAYAAFVMFPRHRVRSRLADAEADRLDESDGAAAAAKKADETTSLPHKLDPHADWTARDRTLYNGACLRIERLIGDTPDWESMRESVIGLVEYVSTEYHGPSRNSRLRFTLPEALLMVSVASDRYRRLIQSHVPFADRVSLSTVASIADRKEDIVRGATWANRIRRGGRLVNPVGALLGEMRDQFTDRVFTSASKALQRDLMRLLLQEIAQVCIDLYSGRLKVADSELARYRSSALLADDARLADSAEPLRVVLLGQTSAGKSSLINALARSLAAETDVLPTTDRTTVHRLAIEELPPLHLVDLPGLDGDAERRRELVDAAMEADLICWVARATQPARAPDAELHAAVRARFESRDARRPPPELLVLTHVDLLSPRAHWSPPYPLDSTDAPGSAKGAAKVPQARGAQAQDAQADANDAQSRKKARNIVAALESARRQIGLADNVTAIPVRIGKGADPYNVDTVAACIAVAAESALEAQLNRRRLDLVDTAGGWRARLGQARNLGLGVGRALLRSAELPAPDASADGADVRADERGGRAGR